jgi:uncharacterized membrane protein YjfL (UPF0719 family)
MTLDQLVTGLIYLAAVFVVFLLGKLVYDKLHPSFVVKHELFERDNVALAIVVVGYYLGLVFALGGILVGPSAGWIEDLIDIGLYGLLAILLLNLSAWLNDKLILRHFDNVKEIIDDRNAGTGAIEAGNHIANGLILAGALSGEGDLVTAVTFWALAQLVLILVAVVYNRVTSFDLHAEVEKDNVAVGVAFAGALIAVGNVLRLAVTGDFVSWSVNLTELAQWAVIGLILLPVVRFLTDKLLVPGVRLNDELVNQEHPNLGAGLLESFSYVAASMLIGWAI